ncbi:MAG: PLP-dependent transferase [Actinomycetota bacterium]|nr:PLP-dependent transferase [Actinomycetota bacterium]
MAVAPARPLLASACSELADDLRELAWIAGDQAGRAIVACGGPMLDQLRDEALADVSALEALALRLADGACGRALHFASARRVAHAHAIRRRQAILAGALVAASWQSPSIRHAHCSQAGPAEGRVTAHRDDYARDRHPAGIAYERALAATRSPGHAALLTSCGMSAVVVALAHLQRAGALRHGVLLGASSYHETRDLVCRAAPDAGCVAEHPDATFAAAIGRRSPSCVVLDAVATECGAAVPDVAGIARALASARPGAWLVVDTSGAPLAASPLALPEVREGRLRALAIESLTKHAQLGLDRVSAGAMYVPHCEAAALDELREHLGANIADASVHALPTPDRVVLVRRLARHARNAGALAERLAAAAAAGVDVAHPALPEHPGHGRLPATWLTLRLGTSEHAAAFVDAALERARAQGVALVEGASFGLDTTRIYAPSPGEGESCGFVRLSAGIEHAEGLTRVGSVLVRALREAWSCRRSL